MNNMKKTIPTLVGGAILLTNASVFAIDEVTNQDNQNQELESDSNVENVEVSTDISNEVTDVIVEVIEDTELKVEEEVADTEEVEVEKNDEVELEKNDVEINNSSNTIALETESGSKITQKEIVNLLSNARNASHQKVMITNKDGVIVREGSDANTAQIGTLKKDEYVDVYEQNTNLGWSKINFEGKMAYVNTSDLVDVKKEYKESSEANLSVRSGAGDTYSEFGKLSKGERVQVYQNLSNGWSKINYNSKIAFVETSKLVETYSSKAMVSVEKVKVYKTASDSSDVLGESKKNETLLIYGEEGEFYKVKFGETFGYVKKNDLTLVQSTEKPQTGDVMVFSYMGAVGISALGLVSVNRKKKLK